MSAAINMFFQFNQEGFSILLEQVLFVWCFCSLSTESEEAQQGDSPTNLIVLQGGHIFSFEVVDIEGKLLSKREIENQLERIDLLCNQIGPSSGVCALTVGDRDTWAVVSQQRGALVDHSAESNQLSSRVHLVYGNRKYRNLWDIAVEGPTTLWFFHF